MIKEYTACDKNFSKHHCLGKLLFNIRGSRRETKISKGTIKCSPYYVVKEFVQFLGDYMNSKEYRKPEWVTRMEEIQKRLSGKNPALGPYFSIQLKRTIDICHFYGESAKFWRKNETEADF